MGINEKHKHAEIVVETGDIQQIDHALLHVRLVDIFGYTFSAAAVSPDSNKVSAIKNADTPKTASEVRSFLVLANYLSRLNIANYAIIAEPLERFRFDFHYLHRYLNISLASLMFQAYSIGQSGSIKIGNGSGGGVEVKSEPFYFNG